MRIVVEFTIDTDLYPVEAAAEVDAWIRGTVEDQVRDCFPYATGSSEVRTTAVTIT